MNVHKHMEAIFVVALAAVGLGTMIIDGMPEADAGARVPVMRDVATQGVKQDAAPMAVVCVPRTGRRA